MILVAVLVGAIVIVVVLSIWQKQRVGDAATDKTVRFATAEAARSGIDRVSAQTRMSGTGWEGTDDGWVQALYPAQSGRHPFVVRVSVSLAGTSQLRLIPEGWSQDVYFGFIPIGPKVPHGTDQYLTFVKLLNGISHEPNSLAGSTLQALSRTPQREPDSGEDGAESRESGVGAEERQRVISALETMGRSRFDRLDDHLGMGLMLTLATLGELINQGDIVRDPGGYFRSSDRHTGVA